VSFGIGNRIATFKKMLKSAVRNGRIPGSRKNVIEFHSAYDPRSTSDLKSAINEDSENQYVIIKKGKAQLAIDFLIEKLESRLNIGTGKVGIKVCGHGGKFSLHSY
jgi:hypothetical protein